MERETQFIGQSATFQDAVDRAARAASLDRPVLVIGERGTGKELIAERLHRLSARWDRPYIIMNCAAMPETLAEGDWDSRKQEFQDRVLESLFRFAPNLRHHLLDRTSTHLNSS